MKPQDLLLLIIIGLVVLFSNNVDNIVAKPTQELISAGEGLVASQIAAHPEDLTAEENIVPTELCKCNGTKKIKSGDGILDVPCPCGQNCTCKKPQAPVVETCKCGCNKVNCNCQSTSSCLPKEEISMVIPKESMLSLYFFTARWCGPCLNFKEKELKKLSIPKAKSLESRGLSVVDIDENTTMWDAYRSYSNGYIPLFVLIKDGKVVEKLIGYRTAEELNSLWNKYDK